jgi:NAD(P)H-dependent flavin oxidoreductase YrpB (nitropropane dioxygenase family)
VIRTRLTGLLGIRHPVVQAAMGYVSGPRLAAATSDAGGLGQIASATMTLAELEGAIAETAGPTGAPFGVNLRADAPDLGSAECGGPEWRGCGGGGWRACCGRPWRTGGRIWG